jgi:hypothetical protein
LNGEWYFRGAGRGARLESSDTDRFALNRA